MILLSFRSYFKHMHFWLLQDGHQGLPSLTSKIRHFLAIFWRSLAFLFCSSKISWTGLPPSSPLSLVLFGISLSWLKISNKSSNIWINVLMSPFSAAISAFSAYEHSLFYLSDLYISYHYIAFVFVYFSGCNLLSRFNQYCLFSVVASHVVSLIRFPFLVLIKNDLLN